MTADEFKDLRKSLRLSVNQLAHCIGANSRTVRLWEDGSKPVPYGIEVFLDVLSQFPDVTAYRLEDFREERSV